MGAYCTELLDALAASLLYPDASTLPSIERATALARPAHPALATALDALAQRVAEDPRRVEEEYTRLFDMQPVCTLNVGYHLFGEQYVRGALLSNLTAELRQAGIDPSPELPDHLAPLLRLLPRLDTEGAEILATELLRPALAVMDRNLKKVSHPYRAVLAALDSLLAAAPSEPVTLQRGA